MRFPAQLNLHGAVSNRQAPAHGTGAFGFVVWVLDFLISQR